MPTRQSKIEKLIAELCPDGVEYLDLGKCIKKNIGGGTPSKARGEYWGGNIPWASVGDLSPEGIAIVGTRSHITGEGLKNSTTNLVPVNAVIAAIKIAPGKMKVAGVDVAINQDLRGLVLENFLNPKYLVYYSQTIGVVGNGAIVKSITSKKLESIKIPVPPIEVQEEIVKVLDTFTELEAELEARKKQYEHYRKDLLAFSEGEAHWIPLSEVGKFSMCKRIFKDETLPTGEIPFYKIGTFGKEPDSFISREIYEKYRGKFSYPKKGDVLLSASGTIGRRVIYDGKPAYFQDSNIVWIYNDESKISNRFLFHYYAVVKWQTEGGTIKRLYGDNMKKIKIPVPPIEEQKRIVSILDKFDALVNDIFVGLPAEIKARRSQYEYYRGKLLTFKEYVGT